MKRPTVYRFRDANGRLLYVGRSLNALERIDTHRTHLDWWDQVVSINVEHFATRDEASDAERAAVFAEQPKHNYNLQCVEVRRAIDRTNGKRAIDGAKLRSVRQARGLSVSELAARTGIKQPHLSNIELGRRQASDDVIGALALNLSVDARAITLEVAA